jgi:hypothetical protein
MPEQRSAAFRQRNVTEAALDHPRCVTRVEARDRSSRPTRNNQDERSAVRVVTWDMIRAHGLMVEITRRSRDARRQGHRFARRRAEPATAMNERIDRRVDQVDAGIAAILFEALRSAPGNDRRVRDRIVGRRDRMLRITYEERCGEHHRNGGRASDGVEAQGASPR